MKQPIESAAKPHLHGTACSVGSEERGGGGGRLNRRDTSPIGQRRRQLFGCLQTVLEDEGLPEMAAREAVLNTLRGRASETIEETENLELLWQLLDTGHER